MNYKEGDKVYWDFSEAEYLQECEDHSYGIIEKVLEKGALVKVKWSNNPIKYPYKVLLSEEEFLKKQSFMEKKFFEFKKSFQDKVKAISENIRELNELADSQNMDLNDLSNLTGPMFAALESCGWRTSSMNC